MDLTAPLQSLFTQMAGTIVYELARQAGRAS